MCAKHIISIDRNNQTFVINDAAVTWLNSQEANLKVVAIVGENRTGKSFLLGKILGTNSFEIGHTTDSHTKGIWGEIKTINNQNYLFLDTEGLFDNANDPEMDVKIFTLAQLMSSYLIFNVTRTFKQTDLDNLGLATKLSMDVTGLNHNQLRNLLPKLVVLIRDFALQLDPGETPTSYLCSTLAPVPNENNQKKELITNSFSSLTCSTLPTPVNDPDQNLSLMETNPTVIRPIFIDLLNTFIQNVITQTPIKSLPNNLGQSVELTGPEFVEMLRNYVAKINSGDSISIPGTFSSIISISAEKSKTLAHQKYREEMNRVSLPLDAAVLENQHNTILNSCKDLIRDKLVLKDPNKLNETFDAFRTRILADVYPQYCTQNHQSSMELCETQWRNHFNPFGSQIPNRSFTDMTMFQNQLDRVINAFKSATRGPAVQNFLNNKSSAIQDVKDRQQNYFRLLEAEAKQEQARQQQREIERIKAEQVEKTRRDVERAAIEAENLRRQLEGQGHHGHHHHGHHHHGHPKHPHGHHGHHHHGHHKHPPGHHGHPKHPPGHHGPKHPHGPKHHHCHPK